MFNSLKSFLHEPESSRGPAPAEAPPDVQAEAPESGAHGALDQAFSVPIPDILKPINDSVESMRGMGLVIGQVLDQLREIYQAPYVQVAPISSNPFIVRLHGRYYSLLYVTAAQAVNLAIPGLGIQINYALTPGWNRVYWPESTEITANAANFNALYMATNNFN